MDIDFKKIEDNVLKKQEDLTSKEANNFFKVAVRAATMCIAEYHQQLKK